MSSAFFPTVPAADIPPKTPLCTTAGGVNIVLCRVRDEIFAASNRCTHAEASFDEGRLRGYRLMCPLHGATFDVRTGESNGQITKLPLTVYQTRIRADGVVEVRVPAGDD